MVLSAAAAAVSVGAVGGVVAPLNLPPSKIPPEPEHWISPPAETGQSRGRELAPASAQSKVWPRPESNPTLALGISSCRKGVGPGLLRLAVTNDATMTRTAAVIAKRGLRSPFLKPRGIAGSYEHIR